MTPASIPSAEVPRRGRRSWRVAAVAAAAALVLAACGGSGGSSDTTSSASPTGGETTSATTAPPSPEPTGEPIKTMTITDLNSQGPVYPNIEFTTQAYQEWINANGGINGRPLEAVVCDGQGTADGSGACARQAVEDGVVAVVGSFTFAPDAIVDVLEPAGVAYFGACCMLGAKEFQSKLAFPLGSHQMYGVGFVKKGLEEGCTKMHAVIIQGAESFFGVLQLAAERLGGADKLDQEFTVLPATSQDYAPQVAEALAGGTDCVLMVVSETPFLAWMPAWEQAAPTAKLFGPQGNLSSKVVAQSPEATEGAYVVGAFPDLSCPAWDDYRAALQAINAPATEDYNSLGGLGTWTAYMAFTQIAESMTDEVNAANFAKAASTAVVNLPGMIPDVNFQEEFTGFPAFLRMFNTSVVYSQVQNGVIAPLGACDEFDLVGPIVAD